ncbi:MAG: hypothetical protein ACOC5T_02950 [Elusimicrobiota bacterium]
MAYTGTLATEDCVKKKAGANRDTSLASDETGYGGFVQAAEGRVIAETQVDWIDIYDDLSDNTQWLLCDIVSNLAAQYWISYDMSGYTSRVEAEDMLTVLRTNYKEGIEALKQHVVKKYVKDN